jgi:hypothetical protein
LDKEATFALARANLLKQNSIPKRATIPKTSHPKRRRVKVSKFLKSRMQQARYLIGLLVCMVVADGLISNNIVSNSLGFEGNLIIESIVGQASFVLLKVVAALISASILWRVFKKHPRLGLVTIILFVSVYTAILWWNLFTWFIGTHNIRLLS